MNTYIANLNDGKSLEPVLVEKYESSIFCIHTVDLLKLLAILWGMATTLSFHFPTKVIKQQDHIALVIDDELVSPRTASENVSGTKIVGRWEELWMYVICKWELYRFPDGMIAPYTCDVNEANVVQDSLIAILNETFDLDACSFGAVAGQATVLLKALERSSTCYPRFSEAWEEVEDSAKEWLFAEHSNNAEDAPLTVALLGKMQALLHAKQEPEDSNEPIGRRTLLSITPNEDSEDDMPF